MLTIKMCIKRTTRYKIIAEGATSSLGLESESELYIDCNSSMRLLESVVVSRVFNVERNVVRMNPQYKENSGYAE